MKRKRENVSIFSLMRIPSHRLILLSFNKSKQLFIAFFFHNHNTVRIEKVSLSCDCDEIIDRVFIFHSDYNGNNLFLYVFKFPQDILLTEQSSKCKYGNIFRSTFECQTLYSSEWKNDFFQRFIVMLIETFTVSMRTIYRK